MRISVTVQLNCVMLIGLRALQRVGGAPCGWVWWVMEGWPWVYVWSLVTSSSVLFPALSPANMN